MLNLMNVFDEMRSRGTGVPPVSPVRRRPFAPSQRPSGNIAGSTDSPAARAEKWVASYGDYLYRYALLRLRHRQAAEDVVQETFLAALKSYRNFQGRSSEKTWLVNILKHKIIDYIRKDSREQSTSDEDLQGYFDDAFDERGHWKPSSPKMPRQWSASDPDCAYQGEQFWTTLQTSLGELPNRIAQAFVLREIEGLDTDEICRTLGITRNNLWVMLHRARGYLRQSLEARGFGETPALKVRLQS